jgi:hypothetical protein
MAAKGLLVILWFPLTLALLVVNLMLLHSMTKKTNRVVAYAPTAVADSRSITAAGLPATGGSGQILGSSITTGDARALLLQNFLETNASPMAPYSHLIVSLADRYGIDFRLVVSIAMCESNAGKKMPKKGEFNAWGIAVYTTDVTGKAFRDWPHALEWVTSYLKEKYYDIGLTDLKDIGAKWAPPSVENGYSWSNCVEEFMGKIQ